jgi:DNA-binding LacI/PurR family transcriptional regulator
MKAETNIKSIAEALKISISTVSRALNNNQRIGLKTRELVKAKAKELRYIRNPASMYLKREKTFVIGVIVPSLQEEFFHTVVKNLENTIEKSGYQLFVFQTRDEKERQEKAIELFLKYRVDAIVVSLAANTTDYKIFKTVEDFGIPVLFFDRVPRSFNAHKIKCDIQKGALEVMDFLKKKNVKNVALINGPSNLEASDTRLNGYLEGIHRYNFESSSSLIKSCDLSKEGVLEVVNNFHNQNNMPDAIFTFNDYIALYAMAECKKLGYIPNKDILFVSYANLPITSLMDNPPLASVEQFPDQIGIASANLVLDLINGNLDLNDYQEILVETKLVVH